MLISCLLVLAGCVVVDLRHAGYYEGIGPVPPGWNCKTSEGGVFFEPRSKPFHDGYIALNGTRKGELWLITSFPPHHVEFTGATVHVVPHDGGTPYDVPIKSVSIQVEATSDFTIEIPSVVVNGSVLPPIVSRLTWTHRAYRTHPPPS